MGRVLEKWYPATFRKLPKFPDSWRNVTSNVNGHYCLGFLGNLLCCEIWVEAHVGPNVSEDRSTPSLLNSIDCGREGFGSYYNVALQFVSLNHRLKGASPTVRCNYALYAKIAS